MNISVWKRKYKQINRFFNQGQAYIGFVSESSCLRVFDTINVVFLETNPSINRPLNDIK